MHISKEDSELFRQTLKNVKPLKAKHKKKIFFPKIPNKNISIRAVVKEPPVINLDDFKQQQVTAEERVFFAKPGLQHKVLKQLTRGNIRPEAMLDLHSHTVSSTKIALEKFLIECQMQKLRCVLIIHGKGQAIIKNAVYNWLNNYPKTLAISSAAPKDGGTGALYLIQQCQTHPV